MKRILDILLSVSLLVFTAPIMLLVAILVRATSPGPAIHWSLRVGQYNRLFRMPKFRTMRVDTPQTATHLLSHPEHWITPVGRFLRATSLDELPQLWSVVKGDMSLIGPRPALFNQDDLIQLRVDHQIHHLKPGITGWAQINGRDELLIPEKVALEREYLHRQSWYFDAWILWLTLIRVLKRDGIREGQGVSREREPAKLRAAS